MKREAINHPKVRLLARDLGISILEARGLLVTLWTVVALNYPRGDIGRLPNDELAVAIDWPHDPDRLVDALVSRRLLDRVSDEQGRLLVHDWHEHADDDVHFRLARDGALFANGAAPRDTKALRRLVRMRNAGGYIAKRVRRAVYNCNGHRCVYCGETDSLTLDHVVPLATGGTNKPDNLQTLCRSCNSRKGAKPHSAFVN